MVSTSGQLSSAQFSSQTWPLRNHTRRERSTKLWSKIDKFQLVCCLTLYHCNWYIFNMYITFSGEFCMTPMCHQVRYQKLCPPFCEDDNGTFLPKTIFNITEKVRTYWTWQMEYCNQWPRLRRWLKFSLLKFDEYL